MAAQKGIARLATLYGTIERMRSLELLVAAEAVDDVACSAAIAATVRRGQVADARAAMASGRREEWQVAETTRSVVEARIMRLNALRKERETTLAEASERHRISRMNMEQMDRAAERKRTLDAMQEDRSSQAESDDRFASRRAWMCMRTVDESR